EQGADRQFRASGLARGHWGNAGPIRAIFKQAFRASGLPEFNPHSFRHALALLGEGTCTTPEQFKAWRQNLGHEQVLTTSASYGAVAAHRQAEIIRSLTDAPSNREELSRSPTSLLDSPVVVRQNQDPARHVLKRWRRGRTGWASCSCRW